jgi:hypothetical protein
VLNVFGVLLLLAGFVLGVLVAVESYKLKDFRRGGATWFQFLGEGWLDPQRYEGEGVLLAEQVRLMMRVAAGLAGVGALLVIVS